MIRSPLVQIAAVAFAALAGYAVPRPEALVKVASAVTAAPAVSCPKGDEEAIGRLTRQVEALEKDLAIAKQRPPVTQVAAAPAPAPKPDEAPEKKKGSWGKANEEMQRTAWAIPAENFQSW
jgi:hypothetical protein